MSQRVLLVEDDPHVQGMARAALESAGFRVEACGSVAEGVNGFSRSAPGLVIVDIGLPDGSGLDFCAAVGLGKTVDTPFVFLTARGDLKTRLAAFAAGAHDYIQKPFAVDELLARVNAQFHIKQLHDDLSVVKRRDEDFGRKSGDLELMRRAHQDVTDMIVHDLKTPLTSIMGTLGLIKSRGLITEADHVTLIDSAGIAADFMLLMVNDLLDVGRAETTGLKTEPAPLDLEPLFEKLQRLFAPRCERLGKTLVARIGPEVGTITTDSILLFRILVNLIANAVKLSAAGSVVELEAAREGGDVRFGVLDRGPGVPAGLKKSIFEKYSTLQPRSLSEDGGTGLGLSFCRLAVSALGGRIWVQDRPGGGSAFMVRLPEKS